MILGIDFDGTCVEDRFPRIGEEISGCSSSIRKFLSDGHQVFVWTCRQGVYLEQVRSWFADRGITDLLFNESPVDTHFEPQPPRKAYADVYIDDRDPRGFPGWEQVTKMIETRTPRENDVR